MTCAKQNMTDSAKRIKTLSNPCAVKTENGSLHSEELLGLERKYRAEGFLFIGGVDEVGRGPLAGPVVACCVVFPQYEKLPPVNDSKKLTEKQRELLCRQIKEVDGVQWALGVVEPEEIDRINILQATYVAMRKAVNGVGQVEFLLVDGNPVPDLPRPNVAIVKGDAKSASIAAASILAKVYRDNLMVELDELYPGYGFAEHKGYGTATHLAALQQLGPCEIHRRSFGPVKRILSPEPEQLEFW